jgi:hypothetical protein
LIARHLPELFLIAQSIKAGVISPSTILRNWVPRAEKIDWITLFANWGGSFAPYHYWNIWPI